MAKPLDEQSFELTMLTAKCIHTYESKQHFNSEASCMHNHSDPITTYTTNTEEQ